ncbi:MAG: TolC family protein [Tannerella sp.]|nr:TolC family protein [Tannerella sp.]
MFTRLRQTGWLLLIALLPLTGWGQRTDTLHIDLETALQVALSDNPTIQIADQEIKRVDYTKKDAWLALLPSIDVTGQYSKVLVPQTMSLAGLVIKLPTDFNANATAQLSLPLFVPALWQTIQMTTLDMQLAVEKAHASKITLRNDVTKAFYGVLLAQDSYNTLKGGLSISEEVYKQAKDRFNLGLASEFDVVTAEVQMKNLQPGLLEVENGIEQAKMLLKMLLGLEITQPVKVTGNLINYNIGMEDVNAFNLSLNANTDLRQLDIQKLQLQKALDLQRTQRMPTLAAFATYGYGGTGNKAGYSFFSQTYEPASTAWFSQGMIGGLQLNIPITGIFTNTYKEKQTKAQINQLSMQLDYLEESLNVQVRTAINSMNNAAKQAESAKSNEEMAQKGYDIALKRYETGTGIIIEVQNASLALTQAQLARRQAIASYLNAKADYDKVTGEE